MWRNSFFFFFLTSLSLSLLRHCSFPGSFCALSLSLSGLNGWVKACAFLKKGSGTPWQSCNQGSMLLHSLCLRSIAAVVRQWLAHILCPEVGSPIVRCFCQLSVVNPDHSGTEWGLKVMDLKLCGLPCALHPPSQVAQSQAYSKAPPSPTMPALPMSQQTSSIAIRVVGQSSSFSPADLIKRSRPRYALSSPSILLSCSLPFSLCLNVLAPGKQAPVAIMLPKETPMLAPGSLHFVCWERNQLESLQRSTTAKWGSRVWQPHQLSSRRRFYSSSFSRLPRCPFLAFFPFPFFPSLLFLVSLFSPSLPLSLAFLVVRWDRQPRLHDCRGSSFPYDFPFFLCL